MTSPPPGLDPQAILSVLGKHRVEYVLIGGYAAQLHGATRPTNDIDVTPATTSGNLRRLIAALRDLRAGIRVDELPDGLPFDTSAEALAGLRILNLRTPYGDLDITFTPDGTAGYDDLARAAIPKTVDGVGVRLANLNDIIRSKRAASRAKDFAALPELEELARSHRLAAEPQQAPRPE